MKAFLLASLCLSLPCISLASLFHDDFDDGNIDGWGLGGEGDEEWYWEYNVSDSWLNITSVYGESGWGNVRM